MMNNSLWSPADLAQLVTGIWFVIFFISYLGQALGLATYVMESVGIYSISKRRQIKHPWLAWFPVANLWLLGSISDQYQYVVRGKIHNRRKVMLILGIALVLLTVFYAGTAMSTMIELFARISEASDSVAVFRQMTPSLIVVLVLAVIVLILSVVLAVFQWMCLYDLYSSCNPKYNITFLLLSIFLNVTRPFFIFFNREKDLGMPPRKTEYIPENPGWQEV